MHFDPLDNLFGAPITQWLLVGLIFASILLLYYGPPDWATKKGREQYRRSRRHLREDRARNDPPT